VPSLRSHLFVFALKHRHLLRGQLRRRTTVNSSTLIPQLRAEAEKGAGFFGKLPASTQLIPVSIGDVAAEWMLPAGAGRDRAILYFHGGGYAIGSIKGHRPIVAKFVHGSGVGALVVGYRLAPEHPFPAALDDSVAAYRWLMDQGVSPSRIAFVGDSAGGGLCLATLLALRDQGVALPAAAVALSPWTDVTNSGESWVKNAKLDTLSWKECQVVFSKCYAGIHDPGLPWISPLFGDLRGMPPTLIYVGSHETLLSDSTRYAEKAKAAGTDIRLEIGKGLFHCYPACAPLFPEATAAMRDICEFIRERVG
jgi:epsilon-lactone hydrolase